MPSLTHQLDWADGYYQVAKTRNNQQSMYRCMDGAVITQPYIRIGYVR